MASFLVGGWGGGRQGWDTPLPSFGFSGLKVLARKTGAIKITEDSDMKGRGVLSQCVEKTEVSH